MNIKINIKSPPKNYEIHIGEDIFKKIPKDLVKIKRVCQVLLVSNELVYKYYGEYITEGLINEGYEVLVYLIPDGEEYKTWHQGEAILSKLLEAGFNRDALVVALGGGVIGDLAGFVASIYQRGIDLIHLPTTLLAQVDSSIGGKVAVNHPLGKNMIGSFYQPLGVWADLSCLKTLPEREWQAGLAEVIKYGVIWDEGFFDFLAENALLLKRRDIDCAREVIFRSCQIKAAIVEQDEQEQGLRTLLNFGHTFGHALEKVTKYQVYRHGEAVAIGMSMASKLAVYLNLCEETVIEKLLFILGRIGLPVSMPEFVALEDILTSLNLDKKIRKKELVFVLPRSIGKVEIVKGIGIESIRNCFIKKG